MATEYIVGLLQIMGNKGTARVLRNHGVHEPCLGFKIGDMKPLQKQLKRNYLLSLKLYDIGIYDACIWLARLQNPHACRRKI